MYFRKERGFSIIELVMVIVLIGIVVLVVAVNWPSKIIDVDQYAERLVADLRYAQHLAQTKNQRTRVNFSAGSYSLTLSDGTTAVEFASGSSMITLPAGMTLGVTNLPSNYVVFSGAGKPYVNNSSPGTLLSSTAVVTLNYSGFTKTVSILPNTGKIQ